MATVNATPQSVVGPITGIDHHTAVFAVRTLLEHLGESPDREGLLRTPERVVASLREMTVGYSMDPAEILTTTFSDECDEMIVVGGIDFYSLCEHHMLPFVGTATVGYIPNGKVLGLSKIPRLVECFARRLQIQERLTNQIASALQAHLQPLGTGVIIHAMHFCVACRGVQKANTRMTTSSLLGKMRDSAPARSEFLGFTESRH